MVNKKLNALRHIATLVSDAELATLKAIEAERQTFAAKGAKLRDQQRELLHSDEPNLAFLSGTTDRWLDWSTAQIKRAASEESFTAAKVEYQKKIAARAFGRAIVLAKLAEQKGG